MAYDRLLAAAHALRQAMGALRVDQVTQAQWDRYAAGRMTKPRPRQARHVPAPVSPGTLRREFNVLRAALLLAWKEKHLLHPPSIKPPADSQPRDRYLTKEEAKRLIDAAATLHVRTFVALAVWTGARRGSILSLTWDRVDLVAGMIDFQEPGRPLTKKRRSIVPINDRLRQALRDAQRARQCEYVVEYNGKPAPTGCAGRSPSCARRPASRGSRRRTTSSTRSRAGSPWPACRSTRRPTGWPPTPRRCAAPTASSIPAYLRTAMSGARPVAVHLDHYRVARSRTPSRCRRTLLQRSRALVRCFGSEDTALSRL